MGSAMEEAGRTLLAAEGGESSNFLIPNGTFFFVLAIFLIVLGVIGKFVVPPIQKVLGEREAMVAKTTEDNRRSVEQETAAEADYGARLAAARTEAAAIRDAARTEGRAVIDEMSARASAEVAGTLREADAELTAQSDAIAGDLRSSVENLAVTLADRVLGVPVASSATLSSTVSGG
jgi:F-type H+-transporting ATPase subunit b